MKWGETLAIILETGVPFVADLIKAFVDGDSEAYRRVSDIIPARLQSRAKLAAEQARLAALREEADGH